MHQHWSLADHVGREMAIVVSPPSMYIYFIALYSTLRIMRKFFGNNKHKPRRTNSKDGFLAIVDVLFPAPANC